LSKEVVNKLTEANPQYTFNIPDGHNTYKYIQVTCDHHGEFNGDLYEALKGRIDCPECNALDKLPDYDKLIQELNDAYSVTQLRPADVPRFRQHIASLQNDRCPLCERELDAPVLDHWHTKGNKGNGMVRLVLCRSCNSLLGKIENALPRYKIPYSLAPKWLSNTAKYMLRDTTNLVHPTEKPKVKISKTEFNRFKRLAEADGITVSYKYPTNGILRGKLLALYQLYVK
jgi:hypothetical protein